MNNKMNVKTNKTFNSGFKLLNTFGTIYSQDCIKNEKMFFNCDLSFAYDKGGPITRGFLDALPSGWINNRTVFDSRVHMLMPGWYPAIPGYHHDDIPRNTPGGQPDYDSTEYHSEHIMGLVNGKICPTNFIKGECNMSAVDSGDLVYRKWDSEIRDMVKENKIKVYKAPSNRLIYFDCHAFHAAEKAIAGGWRWFGRVSRNTARVNNITNEIRQQAQIYLEFPMNGW